MGVADSGGWQEFSFFSMNLSKKIGGGQGKKKTSAYGKENSGGNPPTASSNHGGAQLLGPRTKRRFIKSGKKESSGGRGRGETRRPVKSGCKVPEPAVRNQATVQRLQAPARCVEVGYGD